MKKAFIYIITTIFACLAFMFIDDVYAASIAVHKGSCKTNQLDYANDTYSIDLTCDSDSQFGLLLDTYYLQSGNTLVVSGTVFSGSLTASAATSNVLTNFAYDKLCNFWSSHGWCPYYGENFYNSSNFTVFDYFTNSNNSPMLVVQPFLATTSGHVAFTVTVKQYSGDITSNIYSANNAFQQELNNQKLDSINSSINGAGDKITDSVDKVDETLNDSSIDTDAAGGFFSDFNTEDNGGLSAVITAPLKMVRKATSSCTPLTLQAFDKDIELPCGDTLFWNKPEVAQFRVIWNTIFGGAILFMLLRHVFKTIENVKDPQSDKVEVMKL